MVTIFKFATRLRDKMDNTVNVLQSWSYGEGALGFKPTRGCDAKCSRCHLSFVPFSLP